MILRIILEFLYISFMILSGSYTLTIILTFYS
jgi:hypothetical protein